MSYLENGNPYFWEGLSFYWDGPWTNDFLPTHRNNCIEPNAVETLVNLESLTICFFFSFFLRLPVAQRFDSFYHRRSVDKISRCSKRWTRYNGRDLMWSGISGGQHRCPMGCCRIRNDSLSCSRVMSRGHVICAKNFWSLWQVSQHLCCQTVCHILNLY